MTAREPSAVEVITDALVMSPLSDTGGTVLAPFSRAAAEVLAALKAAGFVVATRDAIRAMSPSEQAELIGGEVRRFTTLKPHRDTHPFCIPRTCPHREYDQHQERVVGPWREVQP